ncbi:hypothetical protein Glove_109g436 [Diversispora epigaea]|uniref:Uncharacterized protein n=1 Tax=Diversispora epigaea TaxID=1348612 RepID=A0A397J4U0_9GLOM|nr:hypothetical protein Glove_109g436 [Diversispora epigaea]
MTNQAFSRLAIDVSALTSVTAFKCTKNLGYELAIIRGYREVYCLNPGVQRVWLDIEINPSSGNWNSGQVRKRQILKEFHTAWKFTGWNFGIYSQTITGDKNWVLDSSLPLWYSIYDKNPVLNNYRPFGGWTQGTGKQYDGDAMLYGTRLDKNLLD